MKFDFLDEDARTKKILLEIFIYQIFNRMQGITLTQLCDKTKDFVSKPTIQKILFFLESNKVIYIERAKKGNPEYITIDPIFILEIDEYKQMAGLAYLNDRISSFIEENENLDTPQYIESIMQIIHDRMSELPLSLVVFKGSFSRWMFYEAYYQLIERLLRNLLIRTERTNDDKLTSLNKIIELIKSSSHSPIGIYFNLDLITDNKDWIIKNI